MSRPGHRPAIALTLALAGALLAVGCAAPSSPGPAAQATVTAPSLNTSLVTAAGTWAIAVMGGSAAEHNNFWQLFVRPAGASRWMLVTPPGTADNGGLVVADGGGHALITGLRPSQDLAYTPLAVTSDTGQAWSSAGPLDASLANLPDALASAPGSGNLLALLASGTATLAAPGYTTWRTLATQRSLASTPAGRSCRLEQLTAAAYGRSGGPLLAGACGRPGTAGIFTARDGTWQAAAPQLPAALADQDVTVLRLTSTATSTVALLAAGAGPATGVLAAWSEDSGSHWALSPLLRLNGAQLTSASFGPGGSVAIVTNGNRGQAITGPGAAWRSLPPLPPGTATLAPDTGSGFDALAVRSTKLTVWHLTAGSPGWAATQTITVPIQFGSSA
jgi:hypothetical protein